MFFRSARAPLANYVTLYNATAQMLNDEAFALFAAPLRLGTFEFLCRSVIGNYTLEETLDRAARYLRLLLPELAVTVSRTRRAAQIEIAQTARSVRTEMIRAVSSLSNGCCACCMRSPAGSSGGESRSTE